MYYNNPWGHNIDSEGNVNVTFDNETKFVLSKNQLEEVVNELDSKDEVDLSLTLIENESYRTIINFTWSKQDYYGRVSFHTYCGAVLLASSAYTQGAIENFYQVLRNANRELSEHDSDTD